MIYEGSCDTEDWSSFDHRNKLHFNVYENRKTLFLIVIILHSIAVFDQINAKSCIVPPEFFF